MRMTPTVILVGILALLAAITLTVVYWPYAKRDTNPSDIFRSRTAEEAAGRKIYLENGCVYCHSQSIRSIDWGHGADRIAQSLGLPADHPTRIEAGVSYVLEQLSGEGHVFGPRAIVEDRAVELLTVERSQIAPAMERLAAEELIMLDSVP